MAGRQPTVHFIGLKELQRAVQRNPQTVLTETRNFIVRGLKAYRSGIQNSPWRVGGKGGGAPVSNDPRYKRKYQLARSGNLRDTHETVVNNLEGRIFPTAPYARYVHGDKATPVKVRGKKMYTRPWLNYVKRTKDKEVQTLYRGMLIKITKDLAK